MSSKLSKSSSSSSPTGCPEKLSLLALMGEISMSRSSGSGLQAFRGSGSQPSSRSTAT
eukprot:CAMPEP_0197684004 /NCGR_PEP_ID=MMETSP1338-20131121/98821_1 /TAXON_ID=43686 ORGANISM="Pelagodinium beii, Strain RCC1491" /NCGR_SAMPLE_ID=MMETSP1338 /ASSEMBLY_ACC=CAM_ASM_000754 /LENGTH=57 /DNA_ID=CAMNT_0043265663 /DNA_START=12 /DNA_END=185 /DNA_ORIENTATION=+